MYIKKKKTAKRSKLLILLIIILIILVLVLLSVFLYDKINAHVVRTQLIGIVEEFHQSEEHVYLEGNRVIGTIRIDKLEIEYPIIKYINHDSLNISICKHPGPDINEFRKCKLTWT